MENKAKELKPCPLCKGEAELTKYSKNDFVINCTSCYCEISGENKNKLIVLWNTRPSLSEPVSDDTFELAQKIQRWIGKQVYQKENILHPAVCCDFAGRTNFINAIKKIIDEWLRTKPVATTGHRDQVIDQIDKDNASGVTNEKIVEASEKISKNFAIQEVWADGVRWCREWYLNNHSRAQLTEARVADIQKVINRLNVLIEYIGTGDAGDTAFEINGIKKQLERALTQQSQDKEGGKDE